MRTSALLPLGTRSISHDIDISALPLGSVVVFTTEVSEDAGASWRVHGFVTVMRGEEIAGKPCGAGIVFTEGNKNPDYRVRTTARLRNGAELQTAMTESIDRVAERDRV
jgi:hypothetical protein